MAVGAGLDFAAARRGQSGIVYCGVRARTETLAQALREAVAQGFGGPAGEGRGGGARRRRGDGAK